MARSSSVAPVARSIAAMYSASSGVVAKLASPGAIQAEPTMPGLSTPVHGGWGEARRGLRSTSPSPATSSQACPTRAEPLLPDPHRQRAAGARAPHEHAAAVADADLGAERAQQRSHDDDMVAAGPAVVGRAAVEERRRPQERVQLVDERGIQQRLLEVGVGRGHADAAHYRRPAAPGLSGRRRCPAARCAAGAS